MLDTSKITNVEVEDIDTSDYPDFSDAFISYAELDGIALTDKQLDELNDDSDFVYEAIQKHLF